MSKFVRQQSRTFKVTTKFWWNWCWNCSGGILLCEPAPLTLREYWFRSGHAQPILPLVRQIREWEEFVCLVVRRLLSPAIYYSLVLFFCFFGARTALIFVGRLTLGSGYVFRLLFAGTLINLRPARTGESRRSRSLIFIKSVTRAM